METYAAGHILVRTKSGTLCKASGGSDGPNAEVTIKATSKEIYVVAAKNRATKMNMGYTKDIQNFRGVSSSKKLTTRELRVPSSTTCVATIPLARSAQNNDATTPATL